MTTSAQIIDAARPQGLDANEMAIWEEAMMLLGVLSLKESSDLDARDLGVVESLASPRKRR